MVCLDTVGAVRLGDDARLPMIDINASMERACGSQEAGCRTRGVEFAPDSPLEEAGFEPLVPSDARFRGRILSVHPRQRRSRHERESKHEGALRLGGTEGSNLPSSSGESLQT